MPARFYVLSSGYIIHCCLALGVAFVRRFVARSFYIDRSVRPVAHSYRFHFRQPRYNAIIDFSYSTPRSDGRVLSWPLGSGHCDPRRLPFNCCVFYLANAPKKRSPEQIATGFELRAGSEAEWLGTPSAFSLLDLAKRRNSGNLGCPAGTTSVACYTDAPETEWCIEKF